MPDFQNHAKRKIDEMRSRLYERGTTPPQRTETALTDEPEPVATTWEHPPEATPEPEVEAEPAAVAVPAPIVEARRGTASAGRKKLRKYTLLAGLAFFMGTILISIAMMTIGNRGISADNISISVNGPFTVGGGETLSLQLGITNANPVPISSATLIIDYPEGTRSVDDDGNLFLQRIPLDTIRAGETINVPARAIIYAEENSEQTVQVTIEYRVEGSNATFVREAEPFRFKVSSAPVVIQASANERISSGQETDITLTVISNSQNTVRDIIVSADYPGAFDFSTANPTPTRAQNTWLISELDPGASETITIRGVLVGSEDDELAMHFSVGAPDANDPTKIASVFNTVSTEFIIEQPFVDIDMVLDGEQGDTVVVEPGRTVTGRITITNNLRDIIYDTSVSLLLGGNALSDPAVSQTDGYYDSLENTITWEPSSRSKLVEMKPGDSVSLTFSVKPNEDIAQTPTITLSAEVESRRVRENRVPEVLIGSTQGTIQVATMPTLLAEARRTSGPVPPRVDQVTNYDMSLLAETASNNLNNVIVTATLPQYVTFVEEVSDRGTIAYNEVTRTVTWTVGNVEVGQPAVGTFNVAFRPSVAQIDKIPVLMNAPRLRAEDAFTGSVVRAEQKEVTTELSTELGFDPDNGRVME